VLAAVAVVAVAGGLALSFTASEKRNRLAYEALVKKVETADRTEAKLAILNAYVHENRGDKYIANANRMIEELRALEAAREFEEIEQTASRLTSEGDIRAAKTVYEEYLNRAGNALHRSKASQAVEKISAQIESEDFEIIKQTAIEQGAERISTYRDYLREHPESSHREDVLRLISEMESEYYLFFQQQVQESDASGSWGKAVEIGRRFLEVYPESDFAEEVAKSLSNSQQEFMASQSFSQLSNRAKAFDTDYESARAVFRDYIEVYPGTPVREKIDLEIDRLTALIEEKRLSGAASRMVGEFTGIDTRFQVKNEETVLDTRTGLMWCLLDSQTVADRCMKYEDATAFVEGLETGGHKNWRLPTPEELSMLHREPSFPSDPTRWYWSSKTDKKYVGQWFIKVDVFQSGVSNEQEIVVKESWQCGSVRAVRRP
jgi:hypothetical protein